MDARRNDLPQDRTSLEAMLRSLMVERDEQRQRAEELYLQNLRLQLELERYKKWYYGPRADRLSSSQDLAQALLEFGEQLQAKAVHPEDIPPNQTEPEYELRRVKRRRGRRNLANFEKLPVTTHVYELNAEQRLCPCCGVERKEIGADESWQLEYLPGKAVRYGPSEPLPQHRLLMSEVMAELPPQWRQVISTSTTPSRVSCHDGRPFS